MNTEADIWARIDQSGGHDACWPWLGPIGHNGYGIHARLFGRYWRAHRLVHFLATGEEPEQVAHHCDNPICCNPKHLFSATPKTNIRDCWAKGRHPVLAGSQNPNSKLTPQQVEEIRALPKLSTPERKALAPKYGVHYNHLYRIQRGICWPQEVHNG